MKTLFIVASVMAVLFLAVPNKVEAQKRNATKTTEAHSQKAAKAPKIHDFKITNIKIIPFDSQTGEFQEEIKPNDKRSFFNAFYISLFVVVEISGQTASSVGPEDFNLERKVEITVIGDQRQIAKKIVDINHVDLTLGSGKFFVPVWLYPLMCSDVKINARITGQETVSTMKRTVPFFCGE